MSTIELLGLSKRYGGVTVVAPTDLRIEQGELVTLLGPSGSGKSTILSMIAGLTTPSEGMVRIGGCDVTHVPPAQRNLGMVFQSYALFPHMTVFDNIAFALSIRSVAKAEIATRVDRALAQVRLGGLERRRPSELSGGQQQRVALARALVFEPEILLLDEPMGALDKNLREEVQLELRQLQRELGVTTVLVTHDQEEALSLSTRLVVLDQGRIQQIDTPIAAYQRPSNRFVAQFIGTANLFRGELRHRDGQALVAFPDGALLGCMAPSGPAGPVDVVVRPEHVELLPADAAQGLRVEVVESVYLGQSSRLHLRTADGVPVVALLQRQGPAYSPGEALRIGWRPANAWAMAGRASL
ncbi:ABC transporter ATP-binding protein [Variovorax ginsengisoli]|uniref:ABC transporter ATP-binding protein n=1 Tax=Variovorax ginsengisoli TaxID=363844 RepID=A0ABT8SE65_9BURK|nr:ABC transporter ATP-binding protein [Variovorax ginsengisoli]MDN8617474.1 ABC transporter ATP-binding protein [Variovorax ginsengisoli]MDO1536644.1 ABC transporter ATP-binding protein [Variovorax ginsengisoli]